MALMFDTRHWLINAINKAQGLSLRPGDVEFLEIWDKSQLPGGGTNVFNTSVRARIKATGREVTFSYNRITAFFTDPQTFYQYSTRFTIKIPLLHREGESLEAALAAGFSRQYGIVMSEADILPGSVKLAADGLSASWTFDKMSFMYSPATYTVQLTGKHVLVDGRVLQVIAPARVQPDAFYEDSVDQMALDMSKAINVAVATAGQDYSAMGKFLATFKPSGIDWAVIRNGQYVADVARMAELALKLRAVDRLPWTYSATATAVATPRINIVNPLAMYNGKTEYFKDDRWKLFVTVPHYRLVAHQLRYLDCVNLEFSHVLILCLNAGPTTILNKSSTREFAILHYNLES